MQKRKKVTRKDVAQSAVNIVSDTLWNGSLYAVTGKFADFSLPVPYKTRLFSGVVKKRVIKQTILQAKAFLISKTVMKALMS